MDQPNRFAEALDAAERLDVYSQTELVAVSVRRLAARARGRVVAAVAQARHEFAGGACQPVTAADLIRAAKS